MKYSVIMAIMMATVVIYDELHSFISCHIVALSRPKHYMLESRKNYLKYIFFFSLGKLFNDIPASIATLAQRQPWRWANVGSPMLGQRGFVNWPNGGAPTVAQRCANIGPTLAH